MRDKVASGVGSGVKGEANHKVSVPDSAVREAVGLIRAGLASHKAADFVRSKGYSVDPATCRKWARGSSRRSAFADDSLFNDKPVRVPDQVVREAVALVESGLSYSAASCVVHSKGYSCGASTVLQWAKGIYRQSAFNQCEQSQAARGEQLCLFN